MHDFHRLEVWTRSRKLAAQVYVVTESFPSHETYGLVSQMRRAAVSMASNIAEGAARGSPADFCRYLRMASGSAGELETQVFVSWDVGMLDEGIAKEMAAEIAIIRKMLYSLERSFPR